MLLVATALSAQGNQEKSLLHHLHQLDHLLAVLAVGAWTAQMGGKAFLWVPLAFLSILFLGLILGLEQIQIPYAELGIGLSIILLGTAIAFNRQVCILIASIGLTLFGLFHGFIHTPEISQNAEKTGAIAFFLFSTASWYMLGNLASYITLQKTYGKELLKAVGFITLLIGFTFVFLIELKGY